MTKLLMKIWGWIKTEEESIGEKPVDVKPEAPKEPELVIPPDQVTEHLGDYKKYWKCKCGWYLKTIVEQDMSYFHNHNNPVGGNIVRMPYTPVLTDQDSFEKNECCPKCGRDMDNVKVVKGREIYNIVVKFYKANGNYLGDFNGKHKYDTIIASSSVKEFKRMEWIEEFKLVEEDLRPELLC